MLIDALQRLLPVPTPAFCGGCLTPSLRLRMFSTLLRLGVRSRLGDMRDLERLKRVFEGATMPPPRGVRFREDIDRRRGGRMGGGRAARGRCSICTAAGSSAARRRRIAR